MISCFAFKHGTFGCDQLGQRHCAASIGHDHPLFAAFSNHRTPMYNWAVCHRLDRWLLMQLVHSAFCVSVRDFVRLSCAMVPSLGGSWRYSRGDYSESVLACYRYQLIAGVVEQRGIERLFENNPRVTNALSFVARTSNTFLGSWWWIGERPASFLFQFHQCSSLSRQQTCVSLPVLPIALHMNSHQYWGQHTI